MRFGTRAGLVLFSLASLILAIWLRLSISAIHDEITTDDDRFYLPPSSWLHVFSLGYNEAAADLVWIKTVIYFGTAAMTNWEGNTPRGKSNHTVNYLTTAADLDPRFRELYAIGNTLSSRAVMSVCATAGCAASRTIFAPPRWSCFRASSSIPIPADEMNETDAKGETA